MRHHTWDLKTGCVPVSLDDDKAYALRPKPKKKPKFFLKNPTSGLDGPWGAVSFVFGRFRGLNREIGQIWDGAAWLRTGSDRFRLVQTGSNWFIPLLTIAFGAAKPLRVCF